MYYDEKSRNFHLKLYLFLDNAKECGKECRLVEYYNMPSNFTNVDNANSILENGAKL